jgi:hypothetical protein
MADLVEGAGLTPQHHLLVALGVLEHLVKEVPGAPVLLVVLVLAAAVVPMLLGVMAPAILVVQVEREHRLPLLDQQ